MKIVDAKVIVTCPGRNFVTLKVVTEDGVYGLGDATLNGRELAVASYLTDHVIPCLIGRDARRIEDIWQYLYKGAYWRRGPVTMSAIAAVDTALWDIKGKALDTPVYDLLGGRSRDSVLVYGHANGRDLEDTVAAVAKYAEMGYKAIRAQSGIPGLASTYGVGKGDLYYEPAEKGPAEREPVEHREVPELHADAVQALARGVRRRPAPAARRRITGCTPIEAARLGKSLEPYHLFWLEDAGAGRGAGKLPPDSPAHDDAAGRRRDLQHHSRLLSADPGAADRLHPHHASSMPAASRTCARSPRWPSCITCGPARTARPT